jgi:mucin-19
VTNSTTSTQHADDGRCEQHFSELCWREREWLRHSGFTKTGTGTLNCQRTNTFTGTTTVSAGALALAGGSALANTGAVILDTSGANLTLGANETVGSLAGVAGTSVTLDSYTLTAGDASNTVFAGALGGAGGLTKAGAGTLTLTGANTFTGTTSVGAGTLALGAADRLANTSTLVVSGGIFDLGGSSNTVAGVQQTGGTLANGTLTSTTAFDMQAGSVSAVLAGTAGLNKTTSGTVTLSGLNIYTGATTVSAGTLALSAADRLNSASSLVVSGGIV